MKPKNCVRGVTEIFPNYFFSLSLGSNLGGVQKRGEIRRPICLSLHDTATAGSSRSPFGERQYGHL